MRGDGVGVEQFHDGLGGEVDFRDFFQDEAGDDFFAEGDEDDVAGLEGEVRGIGERAAVLAENFGGYYLVKHRFIIAYLKCRRAARGVI